MVSRDERGPRVDGGAGEETLLGGGQRVVLATEVQGHDHEVGSARGRGHGLPDGIDARPRDAGRGGPGEDGRAHGAEAEQRDPEATRLHHERAGRRRRVVAHPEVAHADRVEGLARVGKTDGSEVERVVVGERDGVEAGVAERDGELRRGAERVVLVQPLAAVREGALQVPDEQVNPCEEVHHALERVAAPVSLHERHDVASEHKIADQADRDATRRRHRRRRRRRCSRSGSRSGGRSGRWRGRRGGRPSGWPGGVRTGGRRGARRRRAGLRRDHGGLDARARPAGRGEHQAARGDGAEHGDRAGRGHQVRR